MLSLRYSRSRSRGPTAHCSTSSSKDHSRFIDPDLLPAFNDGGRTTRPERAWVNASDPGPDRVAWQIEGDGFTDVAVLRGEGAAEALELPGGQVLETDAALVVLRIEGERPFALMARGTRVLLDGAPRVTATEATGVAVEE